jgi:hypothetical protein
VPDPVGLASPWFVRLIATFESDDADDYQLDLYRIEGGSPVDDNASWQLTVDPGGGRVDLERCAVEPPAGEYAVRVSCVSGDCAPIYELDFWNTEGATCP